MQRRTFLSLSGALAAMACFAACLSPTLPLPPPAEPSGIAQSEEEGVWNVRGNCTPGAVVLIRNINTGVIAGTEDKDNDGRYFVRLEGQECDHAEVWELLGTTSSDATFFVLQAVTSSLPEEGVCD